MSAIITPSRTKISTDRFQEMLAAGALTKYNRVELIEGEMVAMASIGYKRAAAVNESTGFLFSLYRIVR